MKKTVPFSKEIPFKTRIAEITDIEVTHDLKRDESNTISGSFKVNGTYKMTEASQIEEKFDYDLPFIIEVDSKYSINNVSIKISDFYFEIINEDILKVNIEVELDNIEEIKEEEIENVSFERCYDVEEKEEEKNEPLNLDEILNVDADEIINDDKEYININKEELNDIIEVPLKDESEPVKLKSSRPITEIFTNVNDNEDTFKTYHVYIVRENDTLDAIMSKFKITRDYLEEYNDLNDIKIGTKLIIPSANE